MTIQGDPDAILAAWLEDGPTRLPDATRRAIGVATRSTDQRRLPIWVPRRYAQMNSFAKLAVAAVVVVAVGAMGIALLNPGQRSGVGGLPAPSLSVSSAPSAFPLPSASRGPSSSAMPEPSVGALTQAFTSPTFGYAVRYPAGWIVTPTTGQGPDGGGADEFSSPDAPTGGWHLRALSRAIPNVVGVDEWIMGTLTHSAAGCMPSRSSLETLSVDGHEGRVQGFCGLPPATQIEATVVVDKRAYLFTLWDFRSEAAVSEAEARASFDRFMATVTLDPGAASTVAAPASPSTTP
jgi:hypothetical protein